MIFITQVILQLVKDFLVYFQSFVKTTFMTRSRSVRQRQREYIYILNFFCYVFNLFLIYF